MTNNTVTKRDAGKRGGRVPATLQAVFLASSRDTTVHKPCAERVAPKPFFRNWTWKHGGGHGRSTESANDAEFLKDPASGSTCLLAEDSAELVTCHPPPAKPTLPVKTPSHALQQHFDALLQSRGYSTNTFATLQSAYSNRPTSLQLASYNLHFLDMIRRNDVAAVRALLRAGLSPNATNVHGESIVHQVCRRGQIELLQVLLEAGASVQVSDDHGRTPLHDACWAVQGDSASPAFDVVRLLLQRDTYMFQMKDSRGATPLTYVRREFIQQWKNFLETIVDEHWPASNASKDNVPPLALEAPNSLPIPNPKHCLTTQLATMVSRGKMTPDEAMFLQYEQHVESSLDQSDDEDNSSVGSPEDEDSDSVCSHSSSSDSDFSFDEDELADILDSFSCPLQTSS